MRRLKYFVITLFVALLVLIYTSRGASETSKAGEHEYPVLDPGVEIIPILHKTY